jgi:regulator of replication initiation timing
MVWNNIIAHVGGIHIEGDRTIDEQLALDTERAKLKRQIDRLERQAMSEKQPRKKWELVEEVKRLKERMEDNKCHS